MYLDQLPELSRARAIRAHARGVPLRDGERVVAVAFVADGTIVPADTIVRFEVTRGEDPARRLGEALSATGARCVWFYGGDAATRAAAAGLDVQLRPAGGVFARSATALVPPPRVTFRAAVQRERARLADLQHEHAPAFRAPHAEVAEIGGEPVGFCFSEPLDQRWSELCVIVEPAARGNGYGTALLAALADRVEDAGRVACATSERTAGPDRAALEAAGFRLVDYYFIATR